MKTIFLEDLLCQPWAYIFSLKDPTESYSLFFELYANILQKHAPLRKKRVKSWYQPKLMNS